jgi:uncharacterized membrane protein (UPF0127 family)
MNRKAALAVLLSLGACRPHDGGSETVPLGSPAPPHPPAPAPARRTAAVGFPDGSRLDVELAQTPEERERGLMFRTTLGPEEGMLFVFEADSELGFWMKNTFVDLDMAWLDASGKVTALHENVPRSTPGMKDDEVATRGGRGLYVLELAAGQAKRRKVAMGSSLSLSLPPAAR